MSAIKYAFLGLAGIIGLLVSMFGPFKVPFAESLAKSHWRHALIAILAILLLIPMVIGLLIYTFDANRFKPQIIKFVKDHKQRDLAMDGDIKVTFFPKLGLDTGKMSLSQRNSARHFASIDSARFYIAWLPMLRRELEVERVQLNGVHADVVRNKDGSTNFDDLLFRSDSLGTAKFDIEGIHLTRSSINFLDAGRELQLALHDVEVETGRLADSVPSRVRAAFRVDMADPHIDAMVRFDSRLYLEHKTGRYELAGFSLQAQGEAAGLKQLALDMRGSLDAKPGEGMLSLDDLDVAVSGTMEQHAIRGKLSVSGMQATLTKLSGHTLALEAAVSRPQDSLTTSVRLPVFEADEKGFQAAELAADLGYRRGDGLVESNLAGPMAIGFEKRQFRLPGLTATVTARHPLLATPLIANISGKMQIDGKAMEAALAFKGRLDDSEMNGNFSVTHFPRHAYRFDFGASKLDLDRYLVQDWAARLQDDAIPIETGGLDGLDLHGKIRVAGLKLGHARLSRVVADIRSENGVLRLDPFSAHLYGGRLMATASLSGGELPGFASRQRFSGLRIGDALADVAGGKKLTGTGTLSLDLAAAGRTIGAMRKSLHGEAVLVCTHGAISGMDLVSELAQGREKLGMKDGTVTRATLFSGQTEFSEMNVSWAIRENGVTRSALSFKSPLVSGKGEGEIHLDTGKLDYRIAATVSPMARKRNKDLDLMKGITVPIRISGDYAAPDIMLDFVSASGGNAPRLARENLMRSGVSGKGVR